MVILKTFRVPFQNKDGDTVDSEAFVYTSKAQMLAFSEAVKALPVIESMKGGPGRLLAGMSDTTFKLISEGWVESQYGMRDLRRADDGSISQCFIPFLSSVSRTESSLAYRKMFDCIRLVESIFHDFMNINLPRFLKDQISSDANKGLIKAVENTPCEEVSEEEVPGLCATPHSRTGRI